MIESGGWKLPRHERHLQRFLTDQGNVWRGRGTYQRHKYLAAVQHCRDMRTAVDIGGHVGLWSWQMAHDFDAVVAFEPVFEHRKCFNANLAAEIKAGRVRLLGWAAGSPDQSGQWCELQTGPGSSGDTSVVPHSFTGADEPSRRETAKVVTVDEVLNNGEPVDLIKIDCEGFEIFALMGAAATVAEWSPVLCIEQKRQFAEKYGVHRQAAVALARKWGYEVAQEISGDFIMVKP